MPTALKHYMALFRLDHPVGTLLLLWPVACALWLAAGQHPPLPLLLIFGAGIVLMRTAGCIINDIFDQSFDRQVKRTQLRPLAQNKISTQAAFIAFIITLLLAASLLLFLNNYSRLLAVIAAVLTVFYPLCKRFTHVPQLVLGVTFNMGVLMAFAQIQNQIPLQAALLYLSALFWTLAYDTIYALQDKPYDEALGLKSTAILFNNHALFFIALFYFISTLLFVSTVFMKHIPTFSTFIPLLGLMTMIVRSLIQTQKGQYKQAFLSNILIGALMFITVVMTTY